MKYTILAVSGTCEFKFEVLHAPVTPVLCEEVITCLLGWGEASITDIRIRLTDKSERSKDLFSICRDGSGKIVSNTWIGWNGRQPHGERVGLLGHVFTLPDHRCKGLASQVSKLALEEFYTSGGLCLLLGVANESAHRIYYRLGFRVVTGGLDRGESMMLHSRHSSPPQTLLDNYFNKTAPVTYEPATRHNVGDLCLLFQRSNQLISDELFKLGDPFAAEEDCLTMFLLQDSGKVTARILLVDYRVVGIELEIGDRKYSIYSSKK
ncbi:hypothetical protein LOD99_5926 [Oopsacas minuta]|uniref:N-acetyltransferase domain-containing protein n=1 Tax=Oopsacas minuta TaxID=111878 RepID=A0AAV7JN49_9METZ|nr:hypothetical protein LOD99_5926 [Oopsacas minuta]